MNIGKYCKEKGLNKEEYKEFKDNIKNMTKEIVGNLEYNGGMYYNTKDIFKNDMDENIKFFIIQELKKLNIEFIKNNEFYRVVE